MVETQVVFNLAMYKNDKVVKLIGAEGYESLLRHSHDFVETVYILEGEAKHCINGEEIKVKKGDFLIVQPGVTHCFVPCYSGNKFHIENFIFEKDLFPFLRDYPCMTVRHSTDDPAIAGLIGVLEAECTNMEKNNNEIIVHVMHALLLNMIYRYSESFARKNSVESETLGEKIVQFIKEHSNEELTLDKIAGKFYCSKNTIITLFRKNYDTTIYQYLLKIRIEKACELLLMSDLSNREIAEAVGFQDFRNFYRHFKSLVGMTPKGYLEQARREENTHERG